MTEGFKNAHDAREFIVAGKAIVTLESKKTGNWFTYKVSRVPDYRGKQVNRWFVSLLTGPDNENSYSYMGLLDQRDGDIEFRLTAKSKVPETACSVRGFRYMWNHLANGTIPADMIIRHEGKCGRCGRTLTVPESLHNGIGPECIKHTNVVRLFSA